MSQAAKLLLLPDRRLVLVWIPIPGVISYQILSGKQARRILATSDAKQRLNDTAAMLAAFAVAAALARRARFSADPATAYQQLSEWAGVEVQSPTEPSDSRLLEILLILAVAVVLSRLAPPLLPALEPLVWRWLQHRQPYPSSD